MKLETKNIKRYVGGQWSVKNGKWSVISGQKNVPFFVIMQILPSIYCIIFAVLCLLCQPAWGSEEAYLITYGPEAGTIEGDDDFFQVVFIRILEDADVNLLYLRIFDPDCGGRIEARYGDDWNTSTHFRLFGGEGAYSKTPPNIPLKSSNNDELKETSNDELKETSNIKSTPVGTLEENLAGVLLSDKTFGQDPFMDYQWITFAEIHPEQGEKINGLRHFKLVINGETGDDGNRFLIAVSRDRQHNRNVPEVEIFTFSPTITLWRDKIFAEVRFFVPENTGAITVHHFDLANALIGVNTPFRENLPIQTSGQNEWNSGTVILEDLEKNRQSALRFEGGEELPNDATFFINDEQNQPLAIYLPAYVQKTNARPEPKGKTELLADCLSVMFDAVGTTDPEGDALSFFWDFGDGNKGEGLRIVHRYEQAGKYTALLRVEDACGQIYNSVLKTFDVQLNHPPKAEPGDNVVAAPGERIRFDASSSFDPDGKITKHFWEFGDGQRSSDCIAYHAYQKPNIYTASLRVEDDSGGPCNSHTEKKEVWVNAPPVIKIGEDRIASPGQEISFNVAHSIDTDGEIIKWTWDFGDGNSAEGLNVKHEYSASGTYTVTLWAFDNANASNSKTSDKIKVFVNQRPEAEAGKDHRVSAGEEIVFDGSKSIDIDGKIIEYKWDFGDNSSIIQLCNNMPECFRAVHSYSEPGTYLVTMTVRDSSGSTSDTSSDTAQVIVNFPPVAEAGTDQWVTESVVKFDASASVDKDGKLIEYLWDFGDGTKGKGVITEHTYRDPGVYTVKLEIIDDSGTSTARDSDTLMVTVNHLPVADAGPDQIGVPGKNISFDASGSVDPDGEIKSFSWDFGDGTKSEGITTSHTYKTSGKYTVLLTVRDNSGHDAAIGYDYAVVVINQPPKAIAGIKGSDIAAAPGDEIRFDGTRSYDPDGTITSWQWNFTSEGGSDKEFGKWMEDSKGIQKPLTSSTIIRSPKFQCVFTLAGTYAAALTITDNSSADNSTDQDKVFIRVNNAPKANAGKDIHTNERTISFDASASTDADGDTLTYKWDFGDGTQTGAGEKVSHTYSKGGKYPVILTVDDGTGLKNSLSTSSIIVKINDPPIASAGGDKTACAGKVVIFDASSSIDPEGGLLKYHWDFGDGTIAEGINPTKIYTKGGVYPVTLTVKDDSGLEGGDTDTDQILVTVAESPVAAAGKDQCVCSGAIVQFDGTASQDTDGLVNSFMWDFGDGNVGGGSTPVHVYTRPGEYRVRLTIIGDQVSNCENTDTDEILISVVSAPIAEFECPSASELGKPITFDAHASSAGNATIVKYEWDFGDGKRAQGKKVEHTYIVSGRYVVSLTVVSDSSTECRQTTIKKLLVINDSPIAKAFAQAPMSPLSKPDGHGESAKTEEGNGKEIITGINQVVIFTGSASKDPDGVISAYNWDFGDGQTGTGAIVRHQYKSSGKYVITLRVTDNTDLANNSAADTLTVIVNDPPQPVISVINEDGTIISGKIKKGSMAFNACAGKNLRFSAKDSTDADGIVRYAWNFGDGSPGAEGVEISHAYTATGSFVVFLEVDDGQGVNNSKVHISAVMVINDPPVADGGANRVVSPGDNIDFDGSASLDKDGMIISWLWDFSDGTTLKEKKVSHRFEKPGTYKVRLVVTDDSSTECGMAEDTITIRVNAPPIASAGGDREAFSGGVHDAVLFDATGSSDPDGDPLIFYWDFGDGTTAQGPKVNHSFEKPGKYKVKLKVDDSTGLKSGVTWDEITVQVNRR